MAEFQKLFIDTWAKQKGEALADRKYFPPLAPKGKEVVRAIGSSSDDAGGGQMYNTLISVINSAETSVYITNAYFAPDKLIMDALKDAARRGVDVKIILPGVGAFADCNGCTRSDGQVKTENGFPWYFEPSLRSKFSLPAAGTLGNTGRNFFRGDRWVNLDLSFLKRTRITERFGFEIRADMTNFTNTPAFGFPTTTVTSPLFGRIGPSISSTARQTMLGAKLTF